LNPAQPVCLGIDGGATHSFGVAVGIDGRALASADAGSLNFFGSGLPEARRSLEQLLKALRQSLPAGTEFANAVVGCAALFSEATPDEKQRLCSGLLPLGRRGSSATR
jgi:N-acetylglucosamine kinase-like BadF-type ATPase